MFELEVIRHISLFSWSVLDSMFRVTEEKEVPERYIYIIC